VQNSIESDRTAPSLTPRVEFVAALKTPIAKGYSFLSEMNEQTIRYFPSQFLAESIQVRSTILNEVNLSVHALGPPTEECTLVALMVALSE
jgi:hypothetical protein